MGGVMLRLAGGQVESLFDELLPAEVRELPAELAVLDRLLADPRLLAPIEQAWECAARGHGRPTIPMASFVRLMVVKQRAGWGYETLVREVSDSLHLRRFCLLPLTQRAPDESTVRKLVRRLGPETVNELTRVVIGKAQRETRFAARAVRIDSTVVEADIRYPTDAGWPCRAPGCWPARAASWPVGCAGRPAGWWIAPGSLARRCGPSPGRWPGAPASGERTS
jgi:IS5 family transposase